MSVQSTYTRPRRELAHRSGDGIDVTLFWNRVDDTVAVEVIDHTTELAFEVLVPRERALDAFHHPYAYAGSHGVEYELPTLRAA